MNDLIINKIQDFYDLSLPNVRKRNIEIPFLDGKADILTGMRRSGKTFLCYQKIEELLKQGITKDRILYFNFEDDRLLPQFTVHDFDKILTEYFRIYPDNKSKICYFFFDEIHNIPNWELFIRRIIDTEKVKVTITGSNSKLLSRDIATSMRGRAFTTEVFPLSFLEYFNFHDIALPENLGGSKAQAILCNAFDSYFKMVGFPEVQFLEEDNKLKLLQEYVNIVLFKDVVERYQIRNTNSIRMLIKHIMDNPCKSLSINKFYNDLKSLQIKCTKDSLYEYLTYLEDAYLLFKLEIYSNSLRKKQLNPPKIYIIDNALLKSMSFKSTLDLGHLLENLVFLHLRRKNFILNYYQNSDAHEVDFVVRKKNGEPVELIQVCYDLHNEKTEERELRGLQKNMDELGFKSGKIITFNTEKTINENISIIPIWKWLLS